MTPAIVYNVSRVGGILTVYMWTSQQDPTVGRVTERQAVGAP